MDDELKTLVSGIGDISNCDKVVLRGKCTFCGDKVTFRQRAYNLPISKLKGNMVPVQCEGCNSILAYVVVENRLYPHSEIKGLEGLPLEIQNYYEEALRCLSSESPNGAVTLFRKVIHALAIHYGLAEKNDSKNFYDMINKLHSEGHLVEKLRNALLGVKDIGNDGAHINDNEPNMEQAKMIRRLIETVLKSTVLCDEDLNFINDLREEED